MADEDGEQHGGHMHAFGIPAGVVHAMVHDHDSARGRAELRYQAGMRWLESLDVEGLMALRWVLATDADDAFGNNRFYDGVAVTLLRGRGVDPRTGVDPAEQLLGAAAAAGSGAGGS